MKNYLIGLAAISLFISGWVAKGWKDDSIKLAIEETKKETSLVIANELSKQKLVTNNIYQKTIERTRSEKVYLECKNQPEMVELINKALN